MRTKICAGVHCSNMICDDEALCFTCRGVRNTEYTPKKESFDGLVDRPTNALSNQVGGNHYKDMKIQPAEFCHANNIPAIEGAVIKYLCRHKSKNGKEDLLKAIHMIEILISLEYK